MARRWPTSVHLLHLSAHLLGEVLLCCAAGGYPPPPVLKHRPGLVMVLVSSVTAPLRARARPSSEAPVFISMEVRAMMVPTKLVDVAIVAELPTCQKTWQGLAPPIRTTLAPDAVISVLPI